LGLPSRIFEKKIRKGEKGDEITRFDGNHCKWNMRQDGLDKRLSDEKNFNNERNSTG
jgi:hypothetical protein